MLKIFCGLESGVRMRCSRTQWLRKCDFSQTENALSKVLHRVQNYSAGIQPIRSHSEELNKLSGAKKRTPCPCYSNKRLDRGEK
eukprot:155017-Rhodomonas_salina.2